LFDSTARGTDTKGLVGRLQKLYQSKMRKHETRVLLFGAEEEKAYEMKEWSLRQRMKANQTSG